VIEQLKHIALYNDHRALEKDGETPAYVPLTTAIKDLCSLTSDVEIIFHAEFAQALCSDPKRFEGPLGLLGIVCKIFSEIVRRKYDSNAACSLLLYSTAAVYTLPANSDIKSADQRATLRLLCKHLQSL
jgi:hypothetical protein